MKYLLAIVGIISIIGCGSKEDKVGGPTFNYDSFKSKEKLKGKVIAIPNLLLPSRICVIPEKNLLLFIDKASNGFLAKVYSLDSLRYLKSFIKQGEGPNEQISAQTLQYKSDEKKLFVLDNQKKRVFVYSIDSLLDLSSPTALPIESIKIQTPSLRRSLVVGANKILDFRPNFNKDTIAIFNFYDRAGAFKYAAGDYPSGDRKYAPYELNDAFYGGLSFSKNGDRILLDYYTCDILDLYDTSGILIRRIQGPDIFSPDYVSESVAGGKGTMTGPTKKAKDGYSAPAIMGDNYIFVLYDGELASKDDEHQNKLFQFDKNLNPMINYDLDIPILSFDVDLKTRTIYALTHKAEGSIVMYKF